MYEHVIFDFVILFKGRLFVVELSLARQEERRHQQIKGGDIITHLFFRFPQHVQSAECIISRPEAF